MLPGALDGDEEQARAVVRVLGRVVRVALRLVEEALRTTRYESSIQVMRFEAEVRAVDRQVRR